MLNPAVFLPSLHMIDLVPSTRPTKTTFSVWVFPSLCISIPEADDVIEQVANSIRASGSFLMPRIPRDCAHGTLRVFQF